MTAQELKQYVEAYIKTKTAAESTAIATVAEGIVDMVVEQFMPKDGSKVLTDVNFTTALKAKIDGIVANATANDTDANLKNRANHTGSQAISSVTGLQTALDSKPATTTVFDVQGKILIDKLPEAPLSPDQFEEYTLNGTPTLRIKESYLIALIEAHSGGGTPNPTLAATTVSFGTSTTTQNVVNWSAVPNATGYSVSRSTSSEMNNSTVIYTGSNLTFTDTGLTSSTTYYYRVSASAPNYTSSVSTIASKATGAESGGGDYTVNRRVRVNLTSEYGVSASNTPYYWNNIKQAESVLQTPNSTLGSNFVTETNAATTIGLTNPVALASATNSLFTPTADGVYPFAIVGSGIGFDRDGNGTLRVTGLDNTKYYHLYIGSVDNSSGRSFVATVGGETKTKANEMTIGTPGENEFASVYNTEFKNKQASSGSIDIVLNYVGFYQGRVGSIIIEESNMVKP